MKPDKYITLAGEYCERMGWNHDAIPELAKCLEAHDRKTSDITDEMVNRFLCWRLPASFNPDGGVSFDKKDRDPNTHWWPVGTNLFSADQARQMLAHVLSA